MRGSLAPSPRSSGSSPQIAAGDMSPALHHRTSRRQHSPSCRVVLDSERLRDAVVQAVITDALDEPVSLEQLTNRWVHTRESQCHAGLLGQFEYFAHLGGSLRIDE